MDSSTIIKKVIFTEKMCSQTDGEGDSSCLTPDVEYAVVQQMTLQNYIALTSISVYESMSVNDYICINVTDDMGRPMWITYNSNTDESDLIKVIL